MPETSKPPMTVAAINDLLEEFTMLHGLSLSPRAYRTSSWYHDYVCFALLTYDCEKYADLLKKKLLVLCEKHGWTEISVNPRDNEIFVIMFRSNMISGGNARLPWK